MTLVEVVDTATATRNAALANRVQCALNANRRGLRDIVVDAEAGSVRLSGRVGSFFLRQMAITLAPRVNGVRCVVDELEVDRVRLGSY